MNIIFGGGEIGVGVTKEAANHTAKQFVFRRTAAGDIDFAVAATQWTLVVENFEFPQILSLLKLNAEQRRQQWQKATERSQCMGAQWSSSSFPLSTVMLRPYFVHSPPPTAHWRNEIMIRNSSVHTSPLPTGWIEYGRRVDFHCPLPSEWAMGSGWVWTQQMESSPRWADSTHRPNETRFIPKKSTETLSSYISILAKPIPKIQKASESSIFSLSNVIKFIFLR